MTQYYAHSTSNPDKSDWQPLEEHLLAVAQRAEEFAAAFNAGKWGRCAGLLHDAGKACTDFIARLEGKPGRVDHITFGARQALHVHKACGVLLAYAICGHHGGLPDGGVQEKQLGYRLKNGKVAEEAAFLPGLECAPLLDFPFQLQKKNATFSLAFFTRMLFSCLVDADFLDTEKFCNEEKFGYRSSMQPSSISGLNTLLHNFIKEKQQTARSGKVNDIRQNVLQQCLNKALEAQGLYTLTVPTGGGKTLSSLAFALKHAETHGLSRVIYAIPFTSIIEQNAQVFRDALGENNVLEHQSNYHEKEETSGYNKWRSLASENWDAPVVVTTNVQFFESLYSHKTSRCRKLHNIAGSVIVLDEAQAIPTEYLEPCLAALRELVQHYRCTIVLCTATQPALDDSSLGTALPNPREIIDNPGELFRDLRRTKIEFIGTVSNLELAARLDTHEQVLCVVATKKQAQQVFTHLNDKEGAFHLTTNLYPAHRLRVLATIRERLDAGLPCRVVSTSLIEAGVDVDFPFVYRAMAGLDSIAQAAGRCNREGKLALGMVYVYEPDELPAMPWLRRRVSRAKETLRALPGKDCLTDLEPMRRYFELLYDVETLDKDNIVTRLTPPLSKELIFPFREVSEDFRLIADEGLGLIIPGLADDRDAVAKHLEQLRTDPFPHTAQRKLQHYAVTVRTSTLSTLQRAGAVEMIRDRYPVLANMAAYDEQLGLVTEKGEVWEVENLML